MSYTYLDGQRPLYSSTCIGHGRMVVSTIYSSTITYVRTYELTYVATDLCLLEAGRAHSTLSTGTTHTLSPDPLVHTSP